jgi:hypothetical protein
MVDAGLKLLLNSTLLNWIVQKLKLLLLLILLLMQSHPGRNWPADRRWCQLLHDMHQYNIMFHVSHAMMKGPGLQIGAGASSFTTCI